MVEASGQEPTNAERVFDEFVRRRDAGEKVELEDLCCAHPELAAALRELWAAYDALSRLLPGSLDDPAPGATPAGEHRDAGGASSALLETLRAEGLRGRRYRVLGEVARGGMGVVHKIWDGELRRTLAMKVIRGRSASPAADERALARFLEEAQVTGQLDHPGIVPVHELGLGADGRVYFTMRLVEGEELGRVFEHVRTGREGWSHVRALDVLLKICDALSYAHSKGVIHRDLKPANVMVGRFGEVYVMDWGLARVLGQPDTHDLRLRPEPARDVVHTERGERRGETPDSPLMTMDGDAVGTPSYMPPEQARGELERIGPRSDVYAVGAMLYELVGGAAPYAARGERVSSHAIVARLLAGPPEPLSSLAPRAAAELVAICEKAMAREVDERYATMQALADDLGAFVQGRVVRAYETGTWAETRKWVKRNKALAAVTAALVVSATVGAVVFARQAEEARRRTDELLALSSIQDLAELEQRADELWPPGPELLAPYEAWLDQARALVAGRSDDQGTGESSRRSLEEHRTRLVKLSADARILTDQQRRADVESHPAYDEWVRKRAELQWYSRMLELEPWPTEQELVDRLARTTPNASADELQTRASRLLDVPSSGYGREVEAMVLARRALERGRIEDPQSLWSHETLAWALLRNGRIEEAEREARQTVEILSPAHAEQAQAFETGFAAQIARWKTEEARAERRAERDRVASDVAKLADQVTARRTWDFADSESRWWHRQLSDLVGSLESLSDSRTGLMGDTLAEPFGWGITKRYEFARTIRERSVDGIDARRRWDEAIAAIASSPRYGGLQITPQLGLLPIGEDRDSHLWEFAHLQSGVEPARSADGRLVMTQASCLVLVLIPGGTFLMGAQAVEPGPSNFDELANESEGPVHVVELSPHFLSKYEMAQPQWARIAGRDPSWYPRKSDPPHPVDNVSWLDCVRMLARYGLVLPSEAQWEHGCRAGTDTPWWSGAERDSLLGRVNLADQSAARIGSNWREIQDWPELDDGFPGAAAVGKLAANGFGLHEVHGNVAEWCADPMDLLIYVDGPSKDPVASTGGFRTRAVRGGSFISSARQARSSARSESTADDGKASIGLRPARRVDP